jgi:hypothetical protein
LAKEGHDEIVKLLSDHGADANPVDSVSLDSGAFYVAEGGTITSSALCDEKCSGVQPMTAQVIRVVLRRDRVIAVTITSFLDHGAADQNLSDGDELDMTASCVAEGYDYIVRLSLNHVADTSTGIGIASVYCLYRFSSTGSQTQ